MSLIARSLARQVTQLRIRSRHSWTWRGVTTLQALMVCRRAACVRALLRVCNAEKICSIMNACAGVSGSAVARVAIAARSASHQN